VVFTVSVDTVLPVDVIVAGEKLHVALLGRPEHVNATVAVGVKPFCGVNVTVSVPPLPAMTASDATETPSVKSGVVGEEADSVVVLDWFEAVDAPSSSAASTT
jgi:hypothetical protein